MSMSLIKLCAVNKWCVSNWDCQMLQVEEDRYSNVLKRSTPQAVGCRLTARPYLSAGDGD